MKIEDAICSLRLQLLTLQLREEYGLSAKRAGRVAAAIAAGKPSPASLSGSALSLAVKQALRSH